MQDYSLNSLSIVDVSKRQIKALLKEIRRLKSTSFPYPDSEEALFRIEEEVLFAQKNLDDLIDGDSDDLVESTCAAASSRLVEFLPILGFLSRSTSVCNAFEIRDSLLRLVRRVLNSDDAGLIISSEWGFSPFIDISYLGKWVGFPCVLIGIPATEASSAFLLSLAGHEVGHALWYQDDIHAHFTRIIDEKIYNLLDTEFNIKLREIYDIDKSASWNNMDIEMAVQVPALYWVCAQVMELFCDLCGLWIFHEAYLNAFAYLLMPIVEEVGFRSHPYLPYRAEVLLKAAGEYGVAVDNDFALLFPQPEKSVKVPTSTDEFLMEVITKTVDLVIPEAIAYVNNVLEDRGIDKPTSEGVNSCKQLFQEMIPYQEARSIAEVTIAGWDALLDSNWRPDLGVRKEDILNELMLKSFELMEIRDRLR